MLRCVCLHTCVSRVAKAHREGEKIMKATEAASYKPISNFPPCLKAGKGLFCPCSPLDQGKYVLSHCFALTILKLGLDFSIR